jgi:acetyl esterase/lipase
LCLFVVHGMPLAAYQHHMKPLLALLITMSTLLSCGKHADQQTQQQTRLPAQTFFNVPYGGDSAQKMDVYLPEGRSAASTKSIILIHGGSWTAGNKTDLNSYIDSFKTRLPHYAIFNLNYRLVSAVNRFPAQEQDIAAAVALIADSAAAYGIDKNSLVLVGISAGAHLALLQAYKYTTPVAAKAVIDFFGPADLVSMYNKPWHPLVPTLLQMATGTAFENNPELYKSSSPVTFITPQSAPTLILHGGRDVIVSLSQSQALEKKLQAAGVLHDLILYSGEGHGWHGRNMAHSFDAIESFLEKVFVS